MDDDALFPVEATPGGGFDLPDDWVDPIEYRPLRQFSSPAAAQSAAVLVPLLRHCGAMEEDDQAREAKLAILGALADRGGAAGLTVPQICDLLAPRFPRGVVRQQIPPMVEAGTLQRARKSDPRVTPTVQAALALALVPTLVDVRGHRALLEMFDRAQSGAADAEVSADELLARLVGLRRFLTIYAGDARRVARSGEPEEVLVHTAVSDEQLRTRFRLLSHAVHEVESLTGALADLNAAVFDYIEAVSMLTARVLASGRRIADARLLPVQEYQRAVVGADVDRLASVFDGILFDAPAVWLDPEAIERTIVAAAGAAATPEVPEPVAGDDDDAAGLTLLEKWRLNADQLLNGHRTVDLLDRLRTETWPGPAVTTAELVALSLADDRYRVERGEALVITPDGKSSVLTPGSLTYTPETVTQPQERPEWAEEVGA